MVNVSDEFLEYVQEEALSVQVWGHKSAGFGSTPSKGAESDLDVQILNAAKTRSLQDRWAEVIRRLEMWVEIHELTDEGEYAPVEIQKAPEVPCAGVFQLRQVSFTLEAPSVYWKSLRTLFILLLLFSNNHSTEH